MPSFLKSLFAFFAVFILTSLAQQQCYYGEGARNRGPASLVPCLGTGHSSCCLLGDVCLSGNACWSWATGNTYQYGCTDITYQDESCPYKCGFNTSLSPWTAIEYCKDGDPPGIHDTWVCHAPESCGCKWGFSTGMLHLQPRLCVDMGWEGRVALKGPSKLAPYVSLPKTYDGTTAYFSGIKVNGTSTWIETAIPGYTPYPVKQLTTFGPQPTEAILINAKAKPSPSTVGAAVSTTASILPTAAAGDSSTSTSTPTPNHQGLSTAAKAGIGAGIGGFFLLLIIATLAILLYRKRRSRHPPPNQNQTTYPYPIGAPMHASPYFPQPEKDPWQAGSYSVRSSPPMLSPQFDQNQYSHLVPSLYSEQRSAMPSSASPPTELSAGREFHELQTERALGEGGVDKSIGGQKGKPKSSSF